MRKQKRFSLTGGISLIAAAGLYSLFSVFAREIGFSLGLVYQQGVRTLFSALLAFLILWISGKLKKITRWKDWFWFCVRAVVGLVSFLCFFVSANNLTIGTNYFLSYFGMTIGGYTVAKVMFKERMSSMKWVSLFLAMLGLALIYLFDLRFTSIVYVALAFGSGLFGSLWNSLVKKISEGYGALQISMMDSLFAAVVALLLSKTVGEVWLKPSVSTLWGLNVLFAVLYIATDILIVWGFRLLEVHVGSLLMLSEVLFAILIGYLFYGEVLPLTSLLGGVLIIVGISLAEAFET